MQQIEVSLLEAIKNDDLKAFGALMERTQCGAYRLGRFPTLSLMYLYNARKLLKIYEQKFLTIINYNALSEPIELSQKFSAKAGKCLRLYFNEVVSPLEMLLILDNTKRLKRVYPLAKFTSPQIKGRLISIYYIRYSLSVKFVGDDIVIDKRPLSYRERKFIATLCLCAFLAVVLFVGVPVTAVALVPKPIEGEVTKLKQIDFSSAKTYTLKKDIDLPENFTVDEVNCTIVGEGHKLNFGKGAAFGTLNGKLSDMTIHSQGGAIIETISQSATIDNVIFNVTADLTLEDSSAFVAINNYGIINSVTLNVSGKVTAVATLADEDDFAGVTLGGIVLNNIYNRYDQNSDTFYDGIIKDCEVNYTDFELVGEAGANAAFGGVAGVNNGCVLDCIVTGKIVADTFDLAGICVTNNILLDGVANKADLSQTTKETGWNPIVCGIVMTNSSIVRDSGNSGNILSVSDCGEYQAQEGAESIASAAGIAYLSRNSMASPYILSCINTGNIQSRANYRHAYAAGICLSSSGGIENCSNSGEVAGNSANGFDSYVGGITALAYGYVYMSSNDGTITATAGNMSYAGGISAYSLSQFAYCMSSGEISVSAQSAYVGGIFGYTDVASVNTIFGVNPYSGYAENCISQSSISVNVSKTSYVGGIIGYSEEKGFSGNDETTVYYGALVTNCFFLGEYTSNAQYFGNIVGVLGANVYDNNLYGATQRPNFDGNYYVDNTYKAFGATIADESYSVVDDKGAICATKDQILALDEYKAIIQARQN